MVKKLGAIRHLALDMDGTIYRGNTLFDSTLPFLSLCRELGLSYSFLTNNPSKSTLDYVTHLKKMGISATADEIYTSTQATIEYLVQEWPQVKRLYALGTPSMCAEFTDAGFTLLGDSPDQEPDAVVVGFDLTLTYSRLCRAAWWISRKKPFFATNPDLICPTDEPTVLVDCGSICAALQSATGRVPDAVFGKPDPSMIRGILRRRSLLPSQLAMIGDRLYTDIAMARRAGAMGVLVLTGETDAAAAAEAAAPPDLVVGSLDELGNLLRQSFREGVAP
jgi:HAD superfamily hydrolase (TIGR01450 family)